MSGAVSRLPFDTSGFAPSISRWSLRSTSGIGTDSIAPNISPADICFGIWSTVDAEYTFCEPSTRSHAGPWMSADRLCAFGLPRYTATAFFPCSAIRGASRRSISSNASSQLASTSSPSRRISGVVRRSGSSWSCLIPYAFGQMKPWLKTSSASPRTETTSLPSVSISRPHVASQNGQVR